MPEQIQEILQTPQPTQPVQPVPVEPKKKSSFKIIVIFLIVILLLGAGGIYAKKFLSKPKTCTSEALVCPDGSTVGRIGPNCELAPCPSQTPSTTSIPDETANWKTYTNDLLDFTLRYPPNLEVKENIFSAKEGRIEFNSQLGSAFTIEYLGVAGAFGEGCEGNPSETVKVSLLGGSITACMNKRSLWACEFSNPDKSGEFFSINASFGEDLSKEIVLQILSTFKFTSDNIVEGRFCGGMAANLPQNQCPEGYKCKLDGSYPDASGKCVKN